MLTTTNSVGASVVLSTRDLNMRPEQDLAEIVGRFLRVGDHGAQDQVHRHRSAAML